VRLELFLRGREEEAEPGDRKSRAESVTFGGITLHVELELSDLSLPR